MKIAILTSDYLGEIGGISQHIENLTQAIASEHACVVLNLSRHHKSEERRCDPLGRQVYILPRSQNSCSRLFSNTRQRIISILAAESPDVVHVHTLFEAMFLWRRMPAVTSVFTNHCSTYLRLFQYSAMRPLLRSTLNKFNCIICPSTELMQKSEHRCVHMIPNGVNSNQFNVLRRNAFPKERFIRSTVGTELQSRRVLVLTRRLVEKNGVHQFVELNTNFLRTHRQELIVLIAGDGPEKLRLESLIQRADLSETVFLLGSVPHDQIDSLYYSADFCILPSDMEAISISALEAMASGAVVMCSPVGGLRELITSGINGYFLDGKRLRATDVFAPQETLELMRQAAALQATTSYNWAAIAKRTIEVYGNRLAAQKGAL